MHCKPGVTWSFRGTEFNEVVSSTKRPDAADCIFPIYFYLLTFFFKPIMSIWHACTHVKPFKKFNCSFVYIFPRKFILHVVDTARMNINTKWNVVSYLVVNFLIV